MAGLERGVIRLGKGGREKLFRSRDKALAAGQGGGDDVDVDDAKDEKEDLAELEPRTADRQKLVASDAFRPMCEELMAGIMAGVSGQYDKVERGLSSMLSE